MLLCVIGALTGLGIAGYGLFTAAGTATRTVPPENVASVNQRPILRTDFITQLESETGLKFEESSRADQLKVLDEMVREELLVQRALELDFAETDQTTRNALVATIMQQATIQLTTTPPTDAQLQQFYDEHRAQYASEGKLLVRNLVLPANDKRSDAERSAAASAAVAALRAGTSAEQAMARFGLVEPRRFDDDYYFAVKYRLGDALFAQVSGLADSEVAGPLELPDGLHVVLVVRNTRPVPQSFTDARAQVHTDYKDAMQARLLETTMKFLRERSKILIAKDYAADYVPGGAKP
jgi:hypothetical protein